MPLKLKQVDEGLLNGGYDQYTLKAFTPSGEEAASRRWVYVFVHEDGAYLTNYESGTLIASSRPAHSNRLSVYVAGKSAGELVMDYIKRHELHLI
jgi:hypothetical protein